MPNKMNKALITAATVAAVSTLGSPLAHAGANERCYGVSLSGQNDCKAGAAAGAISAIIYAFICTEDSPAFYGLWYTVGILFAGAIGAAAGKLFLKW